MDKAFWYKKRVFLTGHTGFKGSWLSAWLNSLGAHVGGYALQPISMPNMFELCGLDDSVTSKIGDVRDFSNLKAAVLEFEPEIVFHLAAQPLVRLAYREPVDTYATNVMGTVNLLESVKSSSSARVVVNVTTDKCYENNEWQWPYRETDGLGGFDPYSSSKACSELVTSAYRRSYFNEQSARVAIASARAGNVIGGGDWSDDRLIPDILSAFENSRPVTIRNPGAIRPWQHVLEPLAGYLTLAEAMWSSPSVYSESWNFGPIDNDARPVSWIVEQMVNMWGGDARWQLEAAPQPHEAGNLRLDISKAVSKLPWAPRLDLGSALDWTVEWHKCWVEGGNIREKTIEQISRYENVAMR